jgi:hypothetical protein
MPTQTIGKIKVVVNNDSLGPITVRQGGDQPKSKVSTISYGQPLELKRAVDLEIETPENGDAIVYNSTTNSFEVQPVIAGTANVANTVLVVNGGTF